MRTGTLQVARSVERNSLSDAAIEVDEEDLRALVAMQQVGHPCSGKRSGQGSAALWGGEGKQEETERTIIRGGGEVGEKDLVETKINSEGVRDNVKRGGGGGERHDDHNTDDASSQKQNLT